MPPTTRVVLSHQPAGNTHWLLISAGALALAVLAFCLGELSNRPAPVAASAPPVTPVWTQPDIARLDRVLDIGQSGNLQGASSDALALARQLGGRPDLEGFASLLEARAGRANDAEADLLRKAAAANSPLEIAAAQKRLGFVFARRRDFRAATEAFASAASADPLDPLVFYDWGEALRRSGLLQEAIGKFQEVLLRLPAGQPESDSLYQNAALRTRLCQIELGSDADLKTEIDRQLARPLPSVYWLLTAVAYDLQHDDAPAAPEILQRIKAALPPDLFEALLNDYFLRAPSRPLPRGRRLFPRNDTGAPQSARRQRGVLHRPLKQGAVAGCGRWITKATAGLCRARNWQLATGNWQPATGNRQPGSLFVGAQPPAAGSTRPSLSVAIQPRVPSSSRTYSQAPCSDRMWTSPPTGSRTMAFALSAGA